MHMLEAGINLVYIRDFLGHASTTTTEIYARASEKLKEQALENWLLVLFRKVKLHGKRWRFNGILKSSASKI